MVNGNKYGNIDIYIMTLLKVKGALLNILQAPPESEELTERYRGKLRKVERLIDSKLLSFTGTIYTGK